MENRNVEIAQTILNQLGGRRFTAMTGAKNHTAIEEGVQFKIGRNSKAINTVRIQLNWKDLYDVTFSRVSMNRKTFEVKNTVKASYTDIYAEDLQEVFEKATGMFTSL